MFGEVRGKLFFRKVSPLPSPPLMLGNIYFSALYVNKALDVLSNSACFAQVEVGADERGWISAASMRSRVSARSVAAPKQIHHAS